MRERLYQLAIMVVLLGIGLTFLFPYYYMILSSFRIPYYNFDRMDLDLLPREMGLAGYRALFDAKLYGQTDTWGALGAMLKGLGNTMFQEVFILLGTTATSLLAGYAFAKHEFRGRQFLFYLMLAGMIIPAEVTLVPKYVMFTNWGLIKTHWAIIIPAVLGAGGWFLMRMYLSTIPNDYIDAARIDGAGEGHIVFQIMAPLAMPVVLTNGLFTFLGVWNDLMGQLMYVNERSKYTLQMVLNMVQNQYGFAHGPGDPTGYKMQTLFAAMIVASTPTIIVFLIFQRQIVEGTVITGLKI
jgi:multiple sugar transport system permease protein